MIGAFDPEMMAPTVIVLAAMGTFLKLIFKFLTNEGDRHDAEMAAQRKEFTSFLGNHMSEATRAMSDVARQLEDLSRKVRS